MKAVILAGGKGTRLQHLTQDIPKPMIPIGDQPIIHHQLSLLSRYGIQEVYITLNYLKEPLQAFVGTGAQYNLRVHYYEETEPLGTVGGVKALERELQEDFFVLYGDVMMDMDLDRLTAFHAQNNSEVTLVLHPNDHPHDSDLVELGEDGRILAFHPKPHPEGVFYRNMVNAGAYVFSPAIFSYLEEGVKADFGKDIFPKTFDKLRFFGYNTSEYLKDMGTLDRLDQVNTDYHSGKIARRSFQYFQKAIFLDRDGVINEDRPLIHAQEELVLYPYASNAIKRINQSDYVAIVATNQPVVARNLTTIDGLNEIHKKLDSELGAHGAKLDALYYCPHHPDKGYPEENPVYKIECNCRKPKPGMLLEAAGAFNIELSRSFMIGDRGSDIEAGNNAGTMTIGLLSGHGLSGYDGKPDFLADNLEDAVNMIFNEEMNRITAKLLEEIKSQESNVIVAIGGNARSGKSTLASKLSIALEMDGISCTRVNLDDWLLPHKQRAATESVLERYQVQKMEKDLGQLIEGKTIEVGGYEKSLEREPSPRSYSWENERVLVVEGVPALALDTIHMHANALIFTKCSEETYRLRFERLQKWKGLSGEEISKKLETRIEEEFRTIALHENLAEIIIET